MRTRIPLLGGWRAAALRQACVCVVTVFVAVAAAGVVQSAPSRPVPTQPMENPPHIPDAYLPRNSFHAPFSSEPPGWVLSGDAEIRYPVVLLTHDMPGEAGAVWCTHPLEAQSWAVEVEFWIGDGIASVPGGDGMAVWFASGISEEYSGRFGGPFGFQGVAVVLPSLRQDASGTPLLQVFSVHKPVQSFTRLSQLGTPIGECSLPFRRGSHVLSHLLRLSYIDGWLHVLYNRDPDYDQWEYCTSMADVAMPSTPHLGVSAEASGMPDLHLVYRVSAYDLSGAPNKHVQADPAVLPGSSGLHLDYALHASRQASHTRPKSLWDRLEWLDEVLLGFELEGNTLHSLSFKLFEYLRLADRHSNLMQTFDNARHHRKSIGQIKHAQRLLPYAIEGMRTQAGVLGALLEQQADTQANADDEPTAEQGLQRESARALQHLLWYEALLSSEMKNLPTRQNVQAMHAMVLAMSSQLKDVLGERKLSGESLEGVSNSALSSAEVRRLVEASERLSSSSASSSAGVIVSLLFGLLYLVVIGVVVWFKHRYKTHLVARKFD